MIDPFPIIAPAFQLLSAVASVGRVRTKSYVVSRRFNALALGTVAADFAIKYLCTERADHLVGLVVFTILTARTLLLLCFETIEAQVCSGGASPVQSPFSPGLWHPLQVSSLQQDRWRS